MTLAPRQVQHLLQQRILPGTVTVQGQRRLMILSTRGVPMDLALPSRVGQKREKKGR